MSKLGTVLAFLAGAAVGGGSVWYVLKARYHHLHGYKKEQREAGDPSGRFGSR